MTKQVWQVERFSTDVTNQIESLQYFTGRRTQFDSWAPGSLVFTIDNDNGEANGYDLNDKIILTATGTSFYQWFYVQEVLFNDRGGLGAGSTATIVCTDLLGRLGRISVFELPLASEETLLQIQNGFDSLMPSGTSIILQTSDGSSIAAADALYTGTGLNRLNLNMTTEQGWLAVTDVSIYLFGRADIDDVAPGTITFARSASGTLQIGYFDIKRIALGSNYLNDCTVTPPVAAQQNTSNASGVASYGTYGAEFSTVDDTGLQALSFAEWQVYSRSDPDELSFQISVSDTANDLTDLFESIYGNTAVVTVGYQNPGSTTDLVSFQIIQGWSMSVTPAKTDMEIFTSPLTYTNFFTLDSATFGILGGSAIITYNANVRYSKNTYSYNGELVGAGGRLGW